MLLKFCTQYAGKFGKHSRAHRTGKGQFLSQFQRRAMLKNVQTAKQLHSIPMLVRLWSKTFKLGFSSTWIKNFQMYKLGLEKVQELEIKLPTFAGSWRKQGSSRRASTSASLPTLNPLTVWITTNCGKFSKRWEYQTTLPVSWETCMQAKKQQLESYLEQLAGLKLAKGYDKAVY